jgi:hypothetical protein
MAMHALLPCMLTVKPPRGRQERYLCTDRILWSLSGPTMPGTSGVHEAPTELLPARASAAQRLQPVEAPVDKTTTGAHLLYLELTLPLDI